MVGVVVAWGEVEGFGWVEVSGGCVGNAPKKASNKRRRCKDTPVHPDHPSKKPKRKHHKRLHECKRVKNNWATGLQS